MIKLFRKIRQRLLSENPPNGRAGRFSKYLIYAFGEIILVMIGILLAMQVNNWNEQRKQQKQATTLKAALQTELKADLELIKRDLEYIENELKVHNSFAQRLSNAKANNDTLIKIVRHEYFPGFNGAKTLDKTTFNSLEATGTINLFSNEIASGVQKYYRDRDLIISNNKINTQLYYNLVESFLLKYPNDIFSITGPLQDVYWKNADVNTLNAMFNGLLTMRLYALNVRKGNLDFSLEETQNLINQLD